MTTPDTAPFDLPEPMRVNAAIIARCRAEIDSRPKALVRRLLLPILRGLYGFAELGEGFQWGCPLFIRRRAVRVGRYAYIGGGGSIGYPVVIGDLCMVSINVTFAGDDHRFDLAGEPTRLTFAPIPPVTVLEADCWIGAGAIIKAGVRIGRGAVVAAGAIVTRSVEPYAIVVGAPARVVRMRFDAEAVKAHDASLFGAGSPP